ncbi:MAG: helicase-related protein, partial [Burkholderiaceae bacterium]
NFLRDPQLIEVARRNATADNVTQEVFKMHESEKVPALLELLRTRGPEHGRLTQVLVFVNAKIECRRLARQLQKAGINADAIHGDKTQDERTKALEGFKSGAIEVLVATDVAARGLDIVELPVVINYDVPFAAEDYIHRIGRTARAGQSGLTIMLMTGSDERTVGAIEKLIKQKFEIRALDVAQSARVERGDRRERPARRDAYERRPERAHAPVSQPVDDFFSKPYEPGPPPSISGTVVSPVAPPVPAPDKDKPVRVAALLGGNKR